MGRVERMERSESVSECIQGGDDACEEISDQRSVGQREEREGKRDPPG